MKTYLVGGAVRDALLGLPVKDRDWVVVGATPQQMIDQGFRPVGKDFPVFLHPETHEEYALARTERKTARGYHGFEFNTDPGVTLVDDLSRRDLTINAIAQTADGRYVDPFNGRKDIESRCLRHVSIAFAEDPVRVLRIARFKARFNSMGFDIAEDTLALMRRMVDAGETRSLVAERVWQEMHLALASPSPRAFVETLRDCGALHDVLPEIDRLFGVPQHADRHAVIDAGEHALLTLDAATALNPSPAVRFAALCHDVGKGLTPHDRWPRHPLHERRGAALLPALCARLRVPRDIQSLAVLSARWHALTERAPVLQPSALLQLLLTLDALRRPQRFEAFLQVCEANHRARTGAIVATYRPAAFLRDMQSVLAAVDTGAIAQRTADKTEIVACIRTARLQALTHAIEAR